MSRLECSVRSFKWLLVVAGARNRPVLTGGLSTGALTSAATLIMQPLPFLILLTALATAYRLQAQSDVPAAITLSPGPTVNSVELQWPSIPGYTYDLWTTGNLGVPWVSTNLPAAKAQSTVSTRTFPADADLRFYRVQERPIPAGNTNAITTTSIAEMERVIGLTFTAAQRSRLVQDLTSAAWSNRRAYEAMRKLRLLNSDPPAVVFDPCPAGFVFETEQRPITWSPPRPGVMPTNPVDIAFAPLRDLGEWIRSRQITSTELTRLYLDRIKQFDRSLLCVITLTEELALRQAARADEEISAGKYRGPLHGIPYGLKDLFSTRDYRTTWGAAPFRDQVFDEDATVVRKLEGAGAVLVAKTSLGALANGDQWFGGMTRNPWNTSQGSSGSSAGSSAGVAAGLFAFGIGSETYGSIVSPATVCRVTGLRPTFGRVSRAGAMTLSWSMDKVGPICRAVEDCAIVFDAIRGRDPLDASTVDLPFNYTPDLDRGSLRIGYRSRFVGASNLERLNRIAPSTSLISIEIPAFPLEAISTILDVEAATAFEELTRTGGDAYIPEFWANTFRVARTVPAVEYLQADRLRRKLGASMQELFRTIDVYVTSNSDEPNLLANNLTGHPCVVVPNGSGTSLTFVGQLYDEARLLAVARAYQEATGFHTNRPSTFVR